MHIAGGGLFRGSVINLSDYEKINPILGDFYHTQEEYIIMIMTNKINLYTNIIDSFENTRITLVFFILVLVIIKIYKSVVFLQVGLLCT